MLKISKWGRSDFFAVGVDGTSTGSVDRRKPLYVLKIFLGTKKIGIIKVGFNTQ